MTDIVLYFATMIGIYTIAAIGLNFQYGIAGLINFGVVGFFAIGAYTSGLLTLAGAPVWVGLLAGASMAGLVSALIALPTQRLNVHYWAITTVGLAEVIRLILLNEDWLTRGSFGLVGIPRPLDAIVPAGYQTAAFCALVWALAVICYLALRLLVSSPFGRVLKAVREENDLALSLGKPVFSIKVRALAIGGLLIGLAGALYAHYLTFISPADFLPTVTIIMWAMVMIGGRGNLAASVVGVAVVTVFLNSTRFLKDVIALDPQMIASLRMVVIGLLIMAIVVYRPDGLFPERKKEFADGDTPAGR
jgi:ABC-type branched-subunit amino acid transport system permease subunit